MPMTYSDLIYNQESGLINIKVPTFDSNGEIAVVVTGVLVDDPQISFGNTWSPISELNTALDTLQDFQQVIRTDSISNYISASGMAWKGTAHVKVHANFYVINFSSSSNASSQISSLAKLNSLHNTGNTSVKVHAGYQLNLYTGNDKLSCENLDDIITKEDGNHVKGTVTLEINKSLTIKGLLLSSVNIHPSTVCVRSGQPLYYNVDAHFIGYRAPIEKDVEGMFGG